MNGIRKGMEKKVAQDMIDAKASMAKERKELIDKAISMNALTKEEWMRIEEWRDFSKLNSTVDKDSLSLKVALENDSMRREFYASKAQVEEHLFEVINAKTTVQRLRVQLESGTITALLKDGVTMCKEEVEAEVFRANTLAWSLSKKIMPLLGQIRGLAGVTDLLGNKIIGVNKFDEYVKKVEAQLESVGIQLFEMDAWSQGKKVKA